MTDLHWLLYALAAVGLMALIVMALAVYLWQSHWLDPLQPHEFLPADPEPSQDNATAAAPAPAPAFFRELA